MGAEVQRPLATVVIGGVIGAMIMSLLVLRVLYLIFNSPVGRRGQDDMQLEANRDEAVLAATDETCPPIS